MSANNIPILLICYSFPPHPGIGGRRWAKFAKFLAMDGYRTEVFNASNIYNENSLWTKDTISDKINLNSHSFTFQKILKIPKGFLQKSLRKTLNILLRFTRYNTDLITSLPNQAFWDSIERKITDEKIQKVIVSGDPFLFYYASQLKKKVSFELILDYRDLWNDHSFYKKNVQFSEKQSNFFAQCENEALQNCDKIIFVDDHLKETVLARIKTEKPKTMVIPNGLDLNDIEYIEMDSIRTSEKTHIFFWGSISSDLNESLFHFIYSFHELKQNNAAVYETFHITIGGTLDKELEKKIRSLQLENVSIGSMLLTGKEYYKKLMNSDIGITLNSYEYRNSFVTKFSDYLFLNKFIINISYEGKFSEFIRENGIGTTFHKEDDHQFFVELTKKLKLYKKPSPQLRESFELKHLTQQLRSFLYN